MHARPVSAWPVPGGLLERLGLPPAEIEERSRSTARVFVSGRWQGDEAELAASLVYASGDGGLVRSIQIGGGPVAAARTALSGGAAVFVDVGMVAAGLRLEDGRRLAVGVNLDGVARLAAEAGTTRAAAGVRLGWEEYIAGGVVAVGNAPTALLAVLDLARSLQPPACVVATCPGFQIATEAKQALVDSGLPHVVVTGTRGGSGLAVAAINVFSGAR